MSGWQDQHSLRSKNNNAIASHVVDAWVRNENGLIRGRFLFGGSGEIRTHEPFRVAGFQDRCIQPLCHASNGCEAYQSQEYRQDFLCFR